jgi:hypothetical protein
VGKSLATDVASVLEDTSLEPASRVSHLNQVKMLCYLLCQYMEMFEDESKEKSDVITTGKVSTGIVAIISWSHTGQIIAWHVCLSAFCIQFIDITQGIIKKMNIYQ